MLSPECCPECYKCEFMEKGGFAVVSCAEEEYIENKGKKTSYDVDDLRYKWLNSAHLEWEEHKKDCEMNGVDVKYVVFTTSDERYDIDFPSLSICNETIVDDECNKHWY